MCSLPYWMSWTLIFCTLTKICIINSPGSQTFGLELKHNQLPWDSSFQMSDHRPSQPLWCISQFYVCIHLYIIKYIYIKYICAYLYFVIYKYILLYLNTYLYITKFIYTHTPMYLIWFLFL